MGQLKPIRQIQNEFKEKYDIDIKISAGRSSNELLLDGVVRFVLTDNKIGKKLQRDFLYNEFKDLNSEITRVLNEQIDGMVQELRGNWDV